MLTPLEAYKLFIKKFPDARTESICYTGIGGYCCSRCPDGDMVDDRWNINADTGEINDLGDYLGYLKFNKYVDKNDTEMERDEDGCVIGIVYKISDLLKQEKVP